MIIQVLGSPTGECTPIWCSSGLWCLIFYYSGNLL